jgi:hypothetical protein
VSGLMGDRWILLFALIFNLSLLWEKEEYLIRFLDNGDFA